MNTLRKRIIDRLSVKRKLEHNSDISKKNTNNYSQQCLYKSEREFQVLTLEEIRQKRKRGFESYAKDHDPKTPRKIPLKNKSDALDFKIQSLTEIRAQRMQKENVACAEVTSTSSNENDLFHEEKLRQNGLETQKSVMDHEKEETIAMGEKQDYNMDEVEKNDLPKPTESNLWLKSIASKETNEETKVAVEKSNEVQSVASKIDETLLLEEDEEEVDITIKAEEDILKDIDDLLND